MNRKNTPPKKKKLKKILYLYIYHDSCFLLVFLLLYSLSRSYISCNDCQLIIMNWIRGIPYVDYLTVVDHLTVITEYIVNVLNIVKVMLFESFIIYTYIIYKYDGDISILFCAPKAKLFSRLTNSVQLCKIPL